VHAAGHARTLEVHVVAFPAPREIEALFEIVSEPLGDGLRFLVRQVVPLADGDRRHVRLHSDSFERLSGS
jgi:hypothetical protein